MKRAVWGTVLAFLAFTGPSSAQTFAGDDLALANCLSASSELSGLARTMLNGDADAGTKTPGDLVFDMGKRHAGLKVFRDAKLAEVFRGDPPRFIGVLDRSEACIAARNCRDAPVLTEIIELAVDLQGRCLAAFKGS